MRIAIYDTDETSRKCLASALKSVLRDYGVALFAEVFDDTALLIGEIDNGNGYDAVFLEADVSGMNAAYRLRQAHYGGEIVFCSSEADFAVEGYEVGACGYLLKPFHTDRLTRLAKRLSAAQQEEYLVIRHQRAVVRVAFHHILYIESCNTKCLIHSTDGTCYTVYRRLDDLEKELDDPRFIRSHQSFLVNMDRVVKADDRFEMVNGASVAIRRRDHRRIRECYEDYIRRSRTHKHAATIK